MARHDFYVLKGPAEQIDALLEQAPELQWYADRAALVADLAGGARGGKLKNRQYQQTEYGSTPYGEAFVSIEPRLAHASSDCWSARRDV